MSSEQRHEFKYAVVEHSVTNSLLSQICLKELLDLGVGATQIALGQAFDFQAL
jgi:hypothetical protein